MALWDSASDERTNDVLFQALVKSRAPPNLERALQKACKVSNDPFAVLLLAIRDFGDMIGEALGKVVWPGSID